MLQFKINLPENRNFIVKFIEIKNNNIMNNKSKLRILIQFQFNSIFFICIFQFKLFTDLFKRRINGIDYQFQVIGFKFLRNIGHRPFNWLNFVLRMVQ